MHGHAVIGVRARPVPFLDDLVLQAAIGGFDAVLALVLFKKLLALVEIGLRLLVDLLLLGRFHVLHEALHHAVEFLLAKPRFVAVDGVTHALGQRIDVDVDRQLLQRIADIHAQRIAATRFRAVEIAALVTAAGLGVGLGAAVAAVRGRRIARGIAGIRLVTACREREQARQKSNISFH